MLMAGDRRSLAAVAAECNVAEVVATPVNLGQAQPRRAIAAVIRSSRRLAAIGSVSSVSNEKTTVSPDRLEQYPERVLTVTRVPVFAWQRPQAAVPRVASRRPGRARLP